MRTIKIIRIGLLFLIGSFFFSFTALEVYKNTGGEESFPNNKPFDLVIKNARIIDGTGGEITRADIGIRNDKISKIGNKLKTDGAKIFDAAGFTVAPNKLEWPRNHNWVQRDLSSALVRHPDDRIIIAQAQDNEWQGKSVQALKNEGFTQSVLIGDSTALAWVMPEVDRPVASDVRTAYYLLSGWRADLLKEDIGKIAEGYKAQLVIYNHREIMEEQLLTILKREKLPPIQYIIEGSQVQSTKTDS